MTYGIRVSISFYPSWCKMYMYTQHGCNVMRAFLIYLHICVNPIHTLTLACACMYLHTDVLPHSRTHTYTHKNAKQRNTVAFFSGPFLNVIHYRALVLSKRKTILRKKKKVTKKTFKTKFASCVLTMKWL